MPQKDEKNAVKTGVATKYDQFNVVTQQEIENCILSIRGQQVMMDRDLAMLYGVDTKRLNEQVKRNINRFPAHFRFQLTKEECSELVANCDRFSNLKHSTVAPYVFTEQGVAMLSAVLHSNIAVAMSIRIIEAFVAMRHFLVSNAQVFQRLETLEFHQLEMKQHQEVADKKIDEVLKRLDESSAMPTQGIFYDGQIYDAYSFVSDLIRSAKNGIVLIDNYVDDTVLTLLDKRIDGVSAKIYTAKITPQMQLDIERHNKQYVPVDICVFTQSHDRFLCIDDTVYHIGASIKDLGKKWFAFSRFEFVKPIDLISKIK